MAISTGHLSLGDSTLGQADVAVYLDGTEAVAITPNGELARNTSHGTVIQQALDALNADDVLLIAPQEFDTTDVSKIVIADAVTGGSDTDKGHRIHADGAVVNSTVRVEYHDAAVYGLTVDGASGNGFEFWRGQGAHFAHLTAQNCSGDGFSIADEPDAQVAWSYFEACKAMNNDGRGWVYGGDHTNNWCNLNIFDLPIARENGTSASDHGHVFQPNSSYNVVQGIYSESNQGDYGAVFHSHSNSVHGGHLRGSVASLRAGADAEHNWIWGGRYTDGVSFASGNDGRGLFGFCIEASNGSIWGQLPGHDRRGELYSQMDGRHMWLEAATGGAEVAQMFDQDRTQKWKVGMGLTDNSGHNHMSERNGGIIERANGAGIELKYGGGANLYDDSGNQIAELTSAGNLNIAGTVSESHTF